MELATTTTRIADLKTPSEVSLFLTQVAGASGFPVHAIGPLPTADRPVEDGWFMVENWPEDWVRIYIEEGFGEFDPIPRAAALLTRPMTISAVRKGAAGFLPDPRSSRLFDLAAQLGLPCGLLVPVFGPQQYRGFVCFAGPGPDPDPPTAVALHLLGLYAHDRIRQLTRRAQQTAVRLSARERQILSAAGRGQADRDIAQTFGITLRTVRFHFTNIRRKLGADSRAHALAMAANLGILGR